MSGSLTLESLLQDQLAKFMGLLEAANARILNLETDRAAWETERRYLIDAVMELTGAAKPRPQPGEPEKPLEEKAALSAGRLSWNQRIVSMEQQSAARKQQHLKQLAEVAAARRAGGA